MSRPPRGKIKETFDFTSRVNHSEIALYSSFFKLIKKISGRKVWKIMVMKSPFFFLKDMKQPDCILTMGSFVQVISCNLRVDNKLFERWNHDIMISLNLLFRILLRFFLYQDMEGNID